MGCGNTKQKTEVLEPFFQERQKQTISQKNESSVNKNQNQNSSQNEKIKFQQNNVEVVSIEDHHQSSQKQPQTFKQTYNEITQSQRNSVLNQNKQIKNLQISEGIIAADQQRKSKPQVNDLEIQNLENINAENNKSEKRLSVSSKRRGSSQIDKLKELLHEEQILDDGALKMKERRASQGNNNVNNIEVKDLSQEKELAKEEDAGKQQIQMGFSSNPQQNVRRSSRASEFGKQSGRISLQSQGSQQGIYQTSKQSQFMDIKKID